MQIECPHDSCFGKITQADDGTIKAHALPYEWNKDKWPGTLCPLSGKPWPVEVEAAEAVREEQYEAWIARASDDEYEAHMRQRRRIEDEGE